MESTSQHISQPQLQQSGNWAQLFIRELKEDYILSQSSIDSLPSEEREHLSRSKNLRKSNRILASRVKLRHILSELIGCPPAEIDLVTDTYGRLGLHPRYGISRKKLDFSISRCSYGFVIFLASWHYVGADIEKFSPRQKQCFEQYFFDDQIRNEHTKYTAQEIWTRIEAFGKMQGEGLNYGMRKLYHIAINPSCAPISCHFFNLSVGQNVSIAICTSGLPERILVDDGHERVFSYSFESQRNLLKNLRYSSNFLIKDSQIHIK